MRTKTEQKRANNLRNLCNLLAFWSPRSKSRTEYSELRLGRGAFFRCSAIKLRQRPAFRVELRVRFASESVCLLAVIDLLTVFTLLDAFT